MEKDAPRSIGLLAIVNLVLIVPLFFGPSRPESGELRVLSFNVLASNRRFDEVIDFIRASDADVVVLHEVTGRWEEAIEEAAQTFDDWTYEITETRAGGDLFGSLVLTRAGAAVESFGFGLTDPRAIEILLPDGVAMLGNSPAVSFQRVPGGAERPASFNLRPIGRPEQDGTDDRRRGLQCDPLVLPVSPPDGVHRSLELRTWLRARPVVSGRRATRSFRIPIDHLLYSDDLAVVDRRLGPAMGSDHFPLTVDLALTGLEIAHGGRVPGVGGNPGLLSRDARSVSQSSS